MPSLWLLVALAHADVTLPMPPPRGTVAAPLPAPDAPPSPLPPWALPTGAALLGALILLGVQRRVAAARHRPPSDAAE